MARFKLVLIITLLILGILTACAQPAPSGQTIEMRLYYQSVVGTTYDTIACVGFPERIAKATNGRVKVILMPDIVKPIDCIDAVKTKRGDAAWFTALYFTAKEPWVGIGAVPGIWEGEEQYHKAQADTGFLKQLEDWVMSTYNGRVLGDTYTLCQVIYSKNPLKTVDDFKGLKMRTANAEQGQLMTNLGAKPTSVAWAELYMALQTGVVDGAITGLDSGYGSSFYEVVKYVSDWPCFKILNPRYFAINEDYWQALPSDVRTMLEKEIRKISEDQIGTLKKEYDEVVKKYNDKGTTVTIMKDSTQIEKGRAASIKVGNEWIKMAKEKGYTFPADLVKYLKNKGYTI
jgi:TRAP-type C4-dicarboxylate transport system substrate-binding protein